VALKPVAGDHVYVTPPVAVNVVDPPIHIAALFPALMTGFGNTVTKT
jgi:hypothetical protein